MTMTPEDAWNAAIGQLRMEMSKASFDTWVSSARLLEVSDGVFTIGTYNAYSRDWLESRLTTTLSRMITGILGQSTSIQFVVLSDIVNREDEAEPEREAENKLETARPPDELEIQDITRELHTLIVQPDKVVVVPKYLLRWLPLIGPDLFWMVIAFRQARFLNTISSNRNKAFTARAEEIYRWSGMSRATFWRNLDREELAWFIERLPQTGWGLNTETGRAKQNPNRYRIEVDIPMTPMDAEALRDYLVAHDFLCDPVGALTTAFHAPIRDILAFPSPRPSPEQRSMKPCRYTVQSIVTKLLENDPRLQPIPDRQIQDLCTQLSEKLLRPLENFQLSWYFLEEWLPVLGTGPAALVAVLRSYGYYNPITGELRDEIWIEGGYEELAQILGLQRAKTLVEWLPSAVNHGKQLDSLTSKARQEKERIEGLRKNLAKFLQRVDYRPGNAGYAFKFKVKLDAEPLCEKDEVIHSTLQAILTQCQKKVVVSDFTAWIQHVDFDQLTKQAAEWPSSGFETLILDPVLDLRLSNGERSGFETLKQILSSGFETLKQAQVPVLRLFKVLLGLKTLKPLLDSPTSTAQPEQEVEGAEWKLETLLAINHVSQKKREVLFRQETSGKPFVSWLLYAASSRGEAIKDPVSVAISKLLENPGEGAGGAFDRLAELLDEQLLDLIWDELSLNRPSNRDWRQAMENAPRHRVKQLAEQLGLDVSVNEQVY